jgi:hypothetical protein
MKEKREIPGCLAFVGVMALLIVIAVLALIWYFRAPVQSAPAAALGPLATAQPSETPKPSATATWLPSPTIDPAIYIRQTNVVLAQNEADIESTRIQNQANLATLEVMRGTPTALEMTRVSGISTEQAQAKAQAVYVEQETARLMAAIEADKQEASRASLFSLIWKSAVAIVLAIIVTAFIVAAVVSQTYKINLAEWHKATEGTANNLLENLEPVSEITPDLPAYPGGLDTRLFAAFLSPGTLRKAAGLVGAGVPLVHDNFTPIAKCMSEGQFTKLQNALVEYRAATWNDDTHKAGITLTEKGRKFFSDLQTTSPLNQDAPITTPPAVKQSIDDGFIPLGEGGKEG